MSQEPSNGRSPTESGDKESIRVFVRVRPLSLAEQAEPVALTVVPDPNGGVPKHIAVKPGGPDRSFAVDGAFDANSTQLEVYEKAARPIIESVLEGYNGAVIAYGQTSSGKTHTMRGPDSIESEADFGIIPRMVETVFLHIAKADPRDEFHLKVSIMEIYMERLKDLLDPSKANLKIREDPRRGVFVADLSEDFPSDGNGPVECKHAETLTMSTGKLYLVDLAGSEKVSKTGAEGQTLDEAKMINKSLSALGNVINSLTTAGPGSTHIPYRDSKLTRVLQSTLGGNSKTSLICTVSPTTSNEAETISTLRFGQRAKLIENKVVANQVDSVESLRFQLDTIQRERDVLSSYVAVLENCLVENGISLPSKKALTESPEQPLCLGGARQEPIGPATIPEDLFLELEDLRMDLAAKQRELTKKAEETLELEIRLTESRAMVFQLEAELDAATAATRENILRIDQSVGTMDNNTSLPSRRDIGVGKISEEDAPALELTETTETTCYTTTTGTDEPELDQDDAFTKKRGSTVPAIMTPGYPLSDGQKAQPFQSQRTPEHSTTDKGTDSAENTADLSSDSNTMVAAESRCPPMPMDQQAESGEGPACEGPAYEGLVYETVIESLKADLEREKLRSFKLRELYKGIAMTRNTEFTQQLELLSTQLDDLVRQYRAAKAETSELRQQLELRTQKFEAKLKLKNSIISERERVIQEYVKLIAKLQERSGNNKLLCILKNGAVTGAATSTADGRGYNVLSGAAGPPREVDTSRFWTFSSFKTKNTNLGKLNIMRTIRGGGDTSADVTNVPSAISEDKSPRLSQQTCTPPTRRKSTFYTLMSGAASLGSRATTSTAAAGKANRPDIKFARPEFSESAAEQP